MQNLYLFIIWHNAASRDNIIMQDIKRRFKLFRIYNVEWSEKLFAHNLARFYGKKLPKSCKKEREVGLGDFKVVLVYDEKQRIREGNNDRMVCAKRRYRKKCGANVIHASDSIAETNENLLFLFGKTIEEISNEKKSLRITKYNDDLIGANGWKSLDEAVELAKKVNGTEVKDCDNTVKIVSAQTGLLKRLLNAKKGWWPFGNKYFITIGNEQKPIYLFPKK